MTNLVATAALILLAVIPHGPSLAGQALAENGAIDALPGPFEPHWSSPED